MSAQHFKSLKQDWRGQRKGASERLLQWLSESIFESKTRNTPHSSLLQTPSACSSAPPEFVTPTKPEPVGRNLTATIAEVNNISFNDDDTSGVEVAVGSGKTGFESEERKSKLQALATLCTTQLSRPAALQSDPPKARQTRGSVEIMGKSYNLPALSVTESLIPGADDGVFADENIKKGQLSTEYLGEVIRSRPEALRRREELLDDHIRRIGSIFHGEFLDAAIKGQFTLAYFAQHRGLGGMVNDHGGRRNTDLKANVKVKEFDVYWCHPYSPYATVTTRCFYVATRDITRGEELICDYNELFRKLHFDDDDLERDICTVRCQTDPPPATHNRFCQTRKLKVHQTCNTCKARQRERQRLQSRVSALTCHVAELRTQLTAERIEKAGYKAARTVFIDAAGICDRLTKGVSKYDDDYADHSHPSKKKKGKARAFTFVDEALGLAEARKLAEQEAKRAELTVKELREKLKQVTRVRTRLHKSKSLAQLAIKGLGCTEAQKEKLSSRLHSLSQRERRLRGKAARSKRSMASTLTQTEILVAETGVQCNRVTVPQSSGTQTEGDYGPPKLFAEGKYTLEARLKLLYPIIPAVSLRKGPGIIRNVIEFIGGDVSHIPSIATLGRMIIEMKGLSTYQAAQLMKECQHRGFTHDGTNGKQGKMITGCVSGEGKNEGDSPRVLTMGSRAVSDGTSLEGRSAVLDLVKGLRDAAAIAGDQELADKLDITIFNAGSQHDAAPGEDKIDDLLEEDIDKILSKKVPGWHDKTRQEQVAMVRIVRHYCFQHKIDNLSRAVADACEMFLAESGVLPPQDATNRHTPPCFSNYMHTAHKLIGIKHGKPNGETTNIHMEFTNHLERKGLGVEAAMVRALGPLVGDR